jgi:hypothetical protein
MSTTAAEEVRVGMGAIPHESGVAFRVWALHAEAVYVAGSFNDWSADLHPMTHAGDRDWYADIASVAVGDEYRYRIVNGDKQRLRMEAHAREVTNSVVSDPHFDWDGADFHLPAVTELVIYEMHLGTFHGNEDGKSDEFAEAVQKLGHLQRLGVNVMGGDLPDGWHLVRYTTNRRTAQLPWPEMAFPLRERSRSDLTACSCFRRTQRRFPTLRGSCAMSTFCFMALQQERSFA